MKFWHIAVKDLKIRVRDKSAFVILLILPMAMIIILGTVFNWAGSSFTANVALVDLDGGDMATRLTQDVFASPQLADVLVVTTVPSEAEARTLVEQGKTGAAVIIPAGFTSGVVAGTKVSIIVLGNPDTSTQAGVIRNIVESFTAEVQRRQLAASIAVQTLQQSGAVPPQRTQEAVQSVMDEVGTSQQTGAVSVKTTTQEGIKVPRALDYYAVGMALLYLIFTANTGTEGMLEEQRQHTLSRVLTTPTSRVQVLLGKLAGIFVIAALQFTMIIVLTRLLYRVNWGVSVPAVIVMAGVLGTATVLVSERLRNTLPRIMTTPTSVIAFLGGKLMAMMVVGIAQFALFILWGSLVLRVDWGRNPLAVAVMVLVYVFAATGLGVLVGSLCRTMAQASVIATFVTYGTSMIAGSWWPIEVSPPFMQQLARAFPQYWAVNGLNKIVVRGLGFAAIAPNLLVLAVAGAGCLLAGSVIYVRTVRS